MNNIIFFFLMISISKSYGQNKDEIAIKRLLEKEAKTWRSGDIKGHADCWSIKPYSRILVSTGDGNTLDVAPDIMINPSPDLLGKGGTFEASNFKMNISGNNAWVSHDEESTTKEGIKTYTYEIRILEKIKGLWKLVGQSIHVYKTKDLK
jgi:hypothetical protein